jgi:NAD(P)H-flavin reductase
VKELITKVEEIHHFGSGYCQIKLAVPAILDIKAGQFAMLKPTNTFEPLLRRAMAFYQTKTTNNTSPGQCYGL